MTLNEFIPLISNVGFPIVICLYVLTRLEKTLKENTQAFRELTLQIKELKGGIKKR